MNSPSPVLIFLPLKPSDKNYFLPKLFRHEQKVCLIADNLNLNSNTNIVNMQSILVLSNSINPE